MAKAGEKLGNYEVADAGDGSAMLLGKGAGGITYLGRHIHLGSKVAIKVLIHRKNLRQKDRDAFLAEARAAASLSHPHIARILDFGESEQGHPYYVMELCEGGSLEEFRDKSGRPDEHTLAQWLFECASALSYAHRKGILHRDIKPSNLLIARHDDTAVVKLIDFGLAGIAGRDGASEQVIGTPHFAAPEQLLGKAESASDVFSLGASFLWLITGRHLSQGDVKAVVSERLESSGYASALAELPEPWKHVLGRMLVTDPVERYRDGEELLAELSAAFPHHSGQPIPWDPGDDLPWTAGETAQASRWQDLGDLGWDQLWEKSEEGAREGIAISLTARRRETGVPHDVLYFTDLSQEDHDALTAQGDLVARCATALGLGEVLLEKSATWCSVAWPALSADDALTWVRQGNNASTAEILAALEPIAIALDEMAACGFDGIDLHPSMLLVEPGPPLTFSLPLVLPIGENRSLPGESSSTMRGASGASLAAHFASCTYQLLSGRTPPPAAFVNVRAYQATPKLAEHSNRFLSMAIAGTRSGTTCRDVVNGLAYEERVPGATVSGTGASRSATTWRPGASAGGSFASRSNPSLSQPVPPEVSAPQPPPAVPVSVPERPTPAPPPEKAPPATPSQTAPVPPAVRKSKTPLIAAAIALAVSASAGGLFLITKSEPGDPANPQVRTDPPAISASPEPVAETPTVTPTAPAKSGGLAEIVRVPGDAATLSEALAKCSENGTIELSGGSYDESVVLTKSVSIISQETALLEKSTAGSSLVTVKGPVEIVMKNIQIKDTRREVDGGDDSPPPLILASDGATLRFENCLLEGSAGDGISLADKASATFTGSRIRNHRGFGIVVTSGSDVSVSLSEIRENGLSGISALNHATKVTLTGGTSVSDNGRHGVELGFGASLEATGAELNNNGQTGLNLQGGGSSARIEGGTVSGNRKFGATVSDRAKLVVSKTSVENNAEDGVAVESGGSVEVAACRFVSNGKVGAYLVNGTESSLKVSDSSFSGHSDAALAIVGGTGDITASSFSKNGMAVFFGSQARGRVSGNTISPGPPEDSIVLEGSGEVTIENNSSAAKEE